MESVVPGPGPYMARAVPRSIDQFGLAVYGPGSSPLGSSTFLCIVCASFELTETPYSGSLYRKSPEVPTCLHCSVRALRRHSAARRGAIAVEFAWDRWPRCLSAVLGQHFAQRVGANPSCESSAAGTIPRPYGTDLFSLRRRAETSPRRAASQFVNTWGCQSTCKLHVWDGVPHMRIAQGLAIHVGDGSLKFGSCSHGDVSALFRCRDVQQC